MSLMKWSCKKIIVKTLRRCRKKKKKTITIATGTYTIGR